MSRLRVIVWYRAKPAEHETLRATYHEVSKALAGTTGLLGNELLHSTVDPTRLAVCSEWESFEAFREWESGAEHRAITAPLRQYQDPGLSTPFDLLAVVAEHRDDAAVMGAG